MTASELGDLLPIALGILAFLFASIQQLLENLQRRKASAALRDAEQQAFSAASEPRMRSLDAAALPPASSGAIPASHLFNLYSKQIEMYQQETRARASWSFICAIVAMFAGFGFVFWGGSLLLHAGETIVLAAGGLLAGVGGAVSAYITSTFLDVHKLSLAQLNHYFQQPVLNDHILMAQRLADESGDPATRLKAYEQTIASVNALIDSRRLPPAN